MYRGWKDAEAWMVNMIGHRWPDHGGDTMLIRTLLQLTRNSEEADKKIGEILLKATVETRARPPRVPPQEIPGVIRVDLSDSSEDELL